MNPKQPDRLSGKDCDFLKTMFMEHFGLDEDEATMEVASACIAKFEHYISDGPGFTGTVFVLVGGGGPEYVISVARGYDRKYDVYVSESGVLNPKKRYVGRAETRSHT